MRLLIKDGEQDANRRPIQIAVEDSGGDSAVDRDSSMVSERLARLRLALRLVGVLGLFSIAGDILLHSYSVAVSGCPKTIESYIDCGGRGPHLEFLAALGILCLLAGTLLVGWIVYHLIRGEQENG